MNAASIIVIPGRRWISRVCGPAAFLLLLAFTGGGCSVRHYALNQAANALAHTGSTFASDDDPALIQAAAPFSLKLMESVLAENPDHPELLAATAAGFTQFSYAYVQEDADETEPHDLAAAEALRARARRLYLRAQRYGMHGLEVKHPGFGAALKANPKQAVRMADKSDVPLLYWTGASWAAAIALSKDNPELVAQLPSMEALMDRALELDESWNRGAIHTFMITYEMSRTTVGGDAAARSRAQFDRAMALSKGTLAAPMVAYAEAVCVQKQDVKQFESLLNQALAINADDYPDVRLENLIMQRRARWLLSRKTELFLVE
ncbi:MAG: TRAP transporter TatT component family protein [Verrucomicrobiota bacterium]